MKEMLAGKIWNQPAYCELVFIHIGAAGYSAPDLYDSPTFGFSIHLDSLNKSLDSIHLDSFLQ